VKFEGPWTDHTPVMIDLAGAEGDGMYVFNFMPAVTDMTAAGAFLKLVEKHLPKDDSRRSTATPSWPTPA
jgi:hypothetical protein